MGAWIGSTLGMVAADALAIVVGAIAANNLPERFIQLIAAALFLAFGDRHARRWPLPGDADPGGRR